MGIFDKKPAHHVFSLMLPLSLATILAMGITFQAGHLKHHGAMQISILPPDVITVPAGTLTYRPEGEYFRHGFAVDAPRMTISMPADLTIMKYQVSGADYMRCVEAGECKPPEPGYEGDISTTVPATGVNHDDARAYAAWLSRQTGIDWRLPSDAELAFAAGSRFPDETLGVDGNTENPALRWLADYERQTRRRASSDPHPQIYGSFGENEHGLADFGGNIWEWTSNCSSRITLADNGEVLDRAISCGIPVASGKHRAALSAFVRNPKGGGCAVGVPPDNLGFRLVRDIRWFSGLLSPFKTIGLHL